MRDSKFIILLAILFTAVGCTAEAKPFLKNNSTKLTLEKEEIESIRYCMMNPEAGKWYAYNEDVKDVEFELEIYLDDTLHYWMDGDLGLLKNNSGLVFNISTEPQLTEAIENIEEKHNIVLLNERL